ncbi:4-(cytidine 5'-diphospho)-2-C-methyl-D-erythritol kinase [Candidatus Marinamargulisbacteria bacterium SCGC AG-439-L15]|nr:4-(cytidine 5'-diphospho)-2-C-methyl-D-erythritol kinase [Candidatus Marinamargulisbacteria bacterium SCGC AG-439-L15]
MSNTLHAFAKLNLSLLVYRPRADGYHPICSVFQEISLSDTLDITRRDGEKGMTITCNDPEVPLGKDNLLYRIYDAVAPHLSFGLEVHLTKTIPMGAGLGGGSSDAATLLRYLVKEAKLGWSLDKQIEVAMPFGSDIPFFLQGGRALVEGIGEKMTPLPALKGVYFVVIYPNLHVSTQAVYQAYDAAELGTDPQSPPEDIDRDITGDNHLKPLVFDQHPKLQDLEAYVSDKGWGPLHMSGSGSTVFLVGADKTIASDRAAQIQQDYPDYMVNCCEPRHSSGNL